MIVLSFSLAHCAASVLRFQITKPKWRRQHQTNNNISDGDGIVGCFQSAANCSVVARKAAMQVEVRPWQPGDRLGAWSVLREASFSNLWPSFLIALHRSALFCLAAVVLATCIATGTSFLVTVLCLAGLVCLVYCGCLAATLYFLYGPNFNDMKQVESSYFASPDNHFWVAQVGKEIVGTIAVIRKQSNTAPETCAVSVNKNNLTTENGPKILQPSSVESVADKHSPKTAWLRRMAVKKSFRGQGIAKRLVQAVIDFCKERDYNVVFLITTEVHQPARALYTRLGFRQKAFKPYKHLRGFFSVWTYEFEMVLSK